MGHDPRKAEKAHQDLVNAESPAIVETRIFEKFISSDEVDAALKGFHNYHELGRNGTPRDIAETVLFLLSDQAPSVTGVIWDVDDGVMTSREFG